MEAWQSINKHKKDSTTESKESIDLRELSRLKSRMQARESTEKHEQHSTTESETSMKPFKSINPKAIKHDVNNSSSDAYEEGLLASDSSSGTSTSSSSRIVIKLSAERLISQKGLRKDYLKECYTKYNGFELQTSCLEFRVDLSELEHEFGKKVARQKTSISEYSFSHIRQSLLIGRSFTFSLMGRVYNEKLIYYAIIEVGADVNKTDKDGKTALFYALSNDHEKVAHALIESGADVNITDKDGKTALFYALSNDHEKVAHAMIEAGASVNKVDKDGKTALFYAKWNEKLVLMSI
ncbi:phosphate system positive regulatory protein PHO81-like [Actinia tenebrosa]|uniref:Phosphate system positive regulatory protein PHO81-like n=1 Tax=Actinia tenebrosa TaxID=6105 RepID=A0A6P8IJY0_ACTTE|nr:phosphate system positive regulatory protein PHO81-like [Actinia tenebrosa]